jgi:hypothetical protein
MEPVLDTLTESILKTLAYFDVADFPLTSEELFRYLWQPPACSYEQFLRCLTSQPGSLWATKNGYYFLPGRENIIAERERHSIPTEHMLTKARRAISCIAWLPFIEAVLVCNSVGSETATRESDVDLLIITTPGRLWLVRLFAHTILRILGMRTYGSKIAGRMCLSFFIDTDHLNLENYRALPEDIHFAYWLIQMFPVYDRGGVADRFLRANSWLRPTLPNCTTQDSSVTYTRQVLPGSVGSTVKKILEKMWGISYGNRLEAEAKKLQLRSISPRLKELALRADGNVVVSDGLLKLHERDTRREYYAAWKTKYASLSKNS